MGSLNFGNSGTGTITVTGGAFTGGTVSGGAYTRVDSTGTGVSAINNGGTLYSMRVGQGSMLVTGGTWTLLSTQRQNDPLTPLDNGFWSWDVGDTDNQTARFTQTGGTISGTVGGFVANRPGSVGIATFTGANTVMNVTDGRLGVNAGTGSISILAGAKVNTRLIEGGRNPGAISNILVDGAGSQFNGLGGSTAGQLFLARHDTISSLMTVSHNASVSVTAAPTLATGPSGQLLMGENVDGTSTLNIASGGSVLLQGNMFMNIARGPLGDPFNTTSVATVDGAGSSLNIATFAQNNGTTAFTGGQLTVAASDGGTATLSVSNSATANANNTFIGNGGVAGGGVGTIILASGGQFTNLNQLSIESPGSASALKITGGTFANGGSTFMSTNVGDLSTLDVVGGALTNAGQFQVGGSGSLNGGSAIVNISGNGLVSANGGTTSLVFVFAPGVVNIGSGTSKGSLVAGAGGTGVDGVINYNAGTFNTTGTLAVGGSVLLSNAGRNAAGTPSNKKLVEAGSATLTATGVIDLNDNDMLLHDTTAGAKQVYETFVKTARNGGTWDQPGITSTAAKNSVPKNKGLGVISGAEYAAGGGTTFDGKTVVATDTLIKFTFNGDTDLNGVVNFDDYARTDNGFNNHRSGWFNGDFNYSGTVDFDDYALIDQAFNTQGTVTLSTIDGSLAGPGARTIVAMQHGMADVSLSGSTVAMQPILGGDLVDGGAASAGGHLKAVPEPTTLSVIGIGLLGALRRRRRQA